MNISTSAHYSRSFSGYIWRVKLDEYTGKLWIEMRDEANFSVDLFWVDVSDAKDDQLVSGSLSWWDSLAHVHADVLCIQQVTDTSNPGPTNLKLFDSTTGMDKAFFSEVIIEETNGNLIKVIKDRELLDIELTEDASQGKYANQIQRPEMYPEGHEYHETVSSFLRSCNAVNIVGPIMYMENRDIFISYHQKVKEYLIRSLVWVKNEQVILKEVIDEKMSGYSIESFFTFRNYLIFIENRRTVKIHRIEVE